MLSGFVTNLRSTRSRSRAFTASRPACFASPFQAKISATLPSLAFDDHVKVFVPTLSGTIERRDYTPRQHDAQAQILVIDFAVHHAGPATRWALDARPGDKLQIGGPKGSKIISSDDVRRWLLIGDETALPAIGRHVEETKAGAQITSVAAVSDPDEHQDFETTTELKALWTHRPPSAANDPSALLSVIRTLQLQPETFVWIAGEATVARKIRNYFIEERGHPGAWMKAGGYLGNGQARHA